MSSALPFSYLCEVPNSILKFSLGREPIVFLPYCRIYSVGPSLNFESACRIFSLLGLPDPQSWPEVEALQHWRDNTENVRVKMSRLAGGSHNLQHHIANFR